MARFVGEMVLGFGALALAAAAITPVRHRVGRTLDDWNVRLSNARWFRTHR